MEWWHVYLWTRLDSIQLLVSLPAGALVVGFMVCAILLGMAVLEEEEAAIRKSKTGMKICAKWAVVPLILSSIIPTSKDFALIYVLPQIAQSEVIEKDVPELYNAAIKKLKEMIQEED